VALQTANGTLNLGFLTILQEGGGYLGGYLVTNCWGRPLEFRLSSAVQPNRVQQILYGNKLLPFICADLIGKTLVERTATSSQIILTDHESVLDLRLLQETPVVVLLAPHSDPARNEMTSGPGSDQGTAGRGPILCHPGFPDDLPAAQALLERLDNTMDLSEPFARIREAIAEARKLGVMNRG
jgi:hypothetical protein